MTMIFKELDPFIVAKIAAMALEVEPKSPGYTDLCEIAKTECAGMYDTAMHRAMAATAVIARWDAMWQV